MPAGVHLAGAREEARPGQPGLLPRPFLDWPGGHAQLQPLQRGPPAAAPSTPSTPPPQAVRSCTQLEATAVSCGRFSGQAGRRAMWPAGACRGGLSERVPPSGVAETRAVLALGDGCGGLRGCCSPAWGKTGSPQPQRALEPLAHGSLVSGSLLLSSEEDSWGPEPGGRGRARAGASLNPDSQGGVTAGGAALLSSEPPAAMGLARACATLDSWSCLGGNGLGENGPPGAVSGPGTPSEPPESPGFQMSRGPSQAPQRPITTPSRLGEIQALLRSPGGGP